MLSQTRSVSGRRAVRVAALLTGDSSVAPSSEPRINPPSGIKDTGRPSPETLSAEDFVLTLAGETNPRTEPVELRARLLDNRNRRAARWGQGSTVIELRPVQQLVQGAEYRLTIDSAGLRLRESVQRERELVNSYIRFEPLFPWSDNQGVESLVLLVKRSTRLFGAWKRRKQDQVVTLRDYSETGDDRSTSRRSRAAPTMRWARPSPTRTASRRSPTSV